MVSLVGVIGVIAAIALSVSGIPQAVKCWREGSAEGVSLSMIWLIEIGIVFTGIYIWELHGFDLILHGQYAVQFLIWLIVFRYRVWPR